MNTPPKTPKSTLTEANAMAEQTDTRTVSQVLRQFDRIEVAKAKLVKQGLINGDASPEQVVQKLREVIPADLLT